MIFEPDGTDSRDHVTAALGQATAHHAAGRFAEAIRIHRQILMQGPAEGDALHLLGLATWRTGKPEQAVAWMLRSVAVSPMEATKHYNLGNLLSQLLRNQEAVACYRTAIGLVPDWYPVRLMLGQRLYDVGTLDEANACFQEALSRQPDNVEALCGLSLVRLGLGMVDAAVAGYRAAVCLRPDDGQLLSRLAVGCQQAGNLHAAIAWIGRALRITPDSAWYHWRNGCFHVQRGDYRAGWRGLEWRWRLPGAGAHQLPVPRWSGEDLAGRTILLYGEQGLGDTLQFIRYAPLVSARGGRVVVAVAPPLLRLVGTVAGVDMVRSLYERLPGVDFECPLMSLPMVFGTTTDQVPAAIPYLAADAERVAMWRHRLGRGGFKVGVCWQADQVQAYGRERSVPLTALRPLASIPGVRLIALQKDWDRAAAAAEGLPFEDLGRDFDGPGEAFADTAAVMMSLDLIVSCDTVTAHLAGALGRPVWAIHRFAPDWRWASDRTDTPWYPTMRLFRQPAPENWAGAVAAVMGALRAEVLSAR